MELIDYLKKSPTIVDFLQILKAKESHAYLMLSNDAGYNKNMAKILSLIWLCESKKPCFVCESCNKVLKDLHIDLAIYPKKNNIVVDDINEIVDNINLKPFEAECKIYVLNDIDKATIGAQNKLLKSLEEPPHNVRFILTSTNESAILTTISSRCEKIHLPFISKRELQQLFDGEVDNLDLISSFSRNSIGKMFDLINSPIFLELYNICVDLLTNLNNSTQMLHYSSLLINNKKYLLDILEILQIMFRDIMMFNLGVKNEIINKNMQGFEQIALKYNEKACVQILKRIDESKKVLTFNANASGVVDNLLMYILEVKAKCK